MLPQLVLRLPSVTDRVRGAELGGAAKRAGRSAPSGAAMTDLLLAVIQGTTALGVPVAVTMGIAGLVLIVVADLVDPLVQRQQGFGALIGIAPLHVAIVVIVKLTLGMHTLLVDGMPFVTSIASGAKIGPMTRELWPFLGAQQLALGLLTCVSGFSLWLPNVMGYAR